MPHLQCPQCQQALNGIVSECHACGELILSAPVIKFLGDMVVEQVNHLLEPDPYRAKVKVGLYVKFCGKFQYDAELAFLAVTRSKGELDVRSHEAMDDVIKAHKIHIGNLTKLLNMISDKPEFMVKVQHINKILKDLQTLLHFWLLLSDTLANA